MLLPCPVDPRQMSHAKSFVVFLLIFFRLPVSSSRHLLQARVLAVNLSVRVFTISDKDCVPDLRALALRLSCKRSTVINQFKTRRVCRWNKVRSWRTRLKLDFADDDPTSVEVETGDDALADRVTQRHRHVTRRLRRVVALRRELHRRK